MASGDRSAIAEDAGELYSRATSLEHARDFDAAFALYLSAAQGYLHRARILPSDRAAELAKCKAEARVCLERAERIKAARNDTLKPVMKREVICGIIEEQTYILDKSSRVNGTVFPFWSGRDGQMPANESETRSQPPFGSGLLSLSPVWRRPIDVYSAKQLSLGAQDLNPHHIRQNVVTDCSVCSAAAICLHHHRKFNSKLGLKCIYPQDNAGLPLISSNGTYSFCFLVNGTFREATIDDALPFSSEGNPLFITARTSDGKIDLWPALLEKAYMKLLGGYDFPGSNSSIDVHTMTGWIPEHIEINSSAFVREKVFERIYEGFDRGLCVISLGTGSRGSNSMLSVSARNGLQTNLLPTHSYAVVAIHKEADDRWMSILNPWDASLYTSDNPEIVPGLDRLQIRSSSHADDPVVDSIDSGWADLIDVSWDEVCTAFDGLYLNWDPAIFRNSIKFHGSWQTRAGENTLQCVHYYLTLELSSRIGEMKSRREPKNDLWVLLSRHIVDKQRVGEFIAMHAVQLDREETRPEVRAIETDLSLKGTYTSSTHTMTRMAVTGSKAQIALVASYEGAYSETCFSVQAFCEGAEVTWVVQPREIAYERSIEGTFSSRNAGGNSTFPTFMNNPQYRLRLHPKKNSGSNKTKRMGKDEKLTLRLFVEGPRNVPLNVMLVWRREEESKERVMRVWPGDAVVSSGPYSYGVAQAAAHVTPGDYCIIVSAFEPRHRGNFTLRIESALRMDLEDLPGEGAGMFCKIVKGAWQPGMDGGSPRFNNYGRNPMFEVDVRTTTALKLRLQLTKASAVAAINVTLFASSTRRSTSSASSGSSLQSSLAPPRSSGSSTHQSFALGRQIITSGAYADGSSSPAGVVTPQTTIGPGKYIAVTSTFDPGTHATFQLHIFSKADVKVSNTPPIDQFS